MAKGKGSFFGKKDKKEESNMNTEQVQDETLVPNDTENLTDSQPEATAENAATADETPQISREEELQNQVKEFQDKYIRLMAEFDNFRKRSMKERSELIKTAGEDTLINVLPVMDDFERGLSAMQNTTDVEAVKQGVELIYNKFKEFLIRNGVKEIEAKEQDFNVDIHEALTKIPAPTEELKGKVVDVIQKGYSLNEKVIRFAKVVVGE